VLALIEFDIDVPDFSPEQRAGVAVDKVPSHNIRSGPSGCDGTGLKVFGEGEWLEDKHKTKAKRKRWANCPLVPMVVRTGFPVRQP
jgi:hypothetical protein